MRDEKIHFSPRLGIAILLGVGVSFASNHLAARVAFDHCASVAAGVAVRASCTALILFVLMRLQGVRLAIPGPLRPWSLLAGLLIATQSYCLYSAVARIPPALALLGALALASFVKVMGVAFGGVPRTPESAHAHDPGAGMLAP